MSKTKESSIVQWIEGQLSASGFYFANVHGSIFSSTGTPDLICSIDGSFVAIEVKRSGNSPKVAQLDHALRILRSGGRAIIAYEDFDLSKVVSKDLPTIDVGQKEDAYDLYDTVNFKNTTTELILS